MQQLTPLQSWAFMALAFAILAVWIWYFIWPSEEETQPLTPRRTGWRYKVRCVQCKWIAIAPSDLEAAQMYAKHYESEHQS